MKEYYPLQVTGSAIFVVLKQNPGVRGSFLFSCPPNVLRLSSLPPDTQSTLKYTHCFRMPFRSVEATPQAGTHVTSDTLLSTLKPHSSSPSAFLTDNQGPRLTKWAQLGSPAPSPRVSKSSLTPKRVHGTLLRVQHVVLAWVLTAKPALVWTGESSLVHYLYKGRWSPWSNDAVKCVCISTFLFLKLWGAY